MREKRHSAASGVSGEVRDQLLLDAVHGLAPLLVDRERPE